MKYNIYNIRKSFKKVITNLVVITISYIKKALRLKTKLKIDNIVMDYIIINIIYLKIIIKLINILLLLNII